MKVVFLFNEYSLHNHIISSYLRSRPGDLVSLVKVPLVIKGKSRLESGKKLLPQMSLRFVVEKFYEFLLLGAITWTPKILAKGEIFQRLRWIAKRNRIPYLECESITHPNSLDFIRRAEPDVIVTLMHQIVKGELLKIPKQGIVNIHPGLLPEFRGIQPYFWALSQGRERTGATLHRIEDEGIDTGAILSQVSFPVPKQCSVSLAYFLTARAVGVVLPKTIEHWEKGNLSPKQQDSRQGAYYRFPDAAAFRGLWKNGGSVINTFDILSIIAGKYDDFCPDEIRIFLE